MGLIKDRVVAIIGYGNQGRAQALNMRDSGVKNIIIGSRKDESWDMANEDGFHTYSIETACEKADIIFMLLPDEVAPKIYKEQIEPSLKAGNVINFSSGYNITFGYIKPQKDIDVIMVGPRMIGKGVREMYERGEGFSSFIAVQQDASGKALDIALALAKAMGSTKKGAIEVTFKDETYLDLMSEQATWPLILAVINEVCAYLIEKGHSEEAILMELYLSKEPSVMMEKMADVGLFKQLPLHSNTSQYGQLTRFQTVDRNYIRSFIDKQYSAIDNHKFADEWHKEQEEGLTVLNELKEKAFSSNISLSESRVKEKLK